MPKPKSSRLPERKARHASRERILFITGRLAEHSVRKVVDALARQAGFDYEIVVLGVSVAALMHVDWVLRKLDLSGRFDRVILPGWCQGDVELFGRQREARPPLKEYDIQILAEINHAPRMTDDEIVELAEAYWESGADVIDLGCIPGESWARGRGRARSRGSCATWGSASRSTASTGRRWRPPCPTARNWC
jgi:hypothetical protein